MPVLVPVTRVTDMTRAPPAGMLRPEEPGVKSERRSGRGALLPRAQPRRAADQTDGDDPARQIELADAVHEPNQHGDQDDGANSGESHGTSLLDREDGAALSGSGWLQGMRHTGDP